MDQFKTFEKYFWKQNLVCLSGLAMDCKIICGFNYLLVKPFTLRCFPLSEYRGRMLEYSLVWTSPSWRGGKDVIAWDKVGRLIYGQHNLEIKRTLFDDA